VHLAFSPVFLGKGERLFSGINIPKLDFNQILRVEGEKVTHSLLTREIK